MLRLLVGARRTFLIPQESFNLAPKILPLRSLYGIIFTMAGKEAPLTFNEYQGKARTTAIYPDKDNNFVYPTLGLTGETGEISEIIKKVLRDNNGEIDEETREKLKMELGDVLWYAANFAEEIGLSLDEVARANLEKLASRQKRDVLHGSGDDR